MHTQGRPYRIWARSLLSPRERLLPGVGARLSGHPRLASALLVALRRLPGRRLRSLAYRRVSLPLAQRLAAELDVPVVGGFRMIADTSDVPGRALATSGIWEPFVTATLRRLLSAGDVAVDVGSNAGYFTVLASRLVGPSGHVYALEPGPEAFAMLRRNLDLNGVSNVTALPVAAGAEEGRATLFGPAPGNTATSSLRHAAPVPESAAGGAAATEVPVRPLRSVLRPADLERLRVVKIDVEGYEVEVLRGLEPIFDRGLRPALIVEVHASIDPDAPAYIVEFCQRYGLHASWLVDDDAPDLRAAPADRVPASRELGSPPDFGCIPRNRYDVLLTG